MNVYVRWYNKVVEGTVVNEHGMFDMTEVRIPIQGVQATALFHPHHVYKTAKEAYGEYPTHFPTPAEVIHPTFIDNPGIGELVQQAINEAKKATNYFYDEYQKAKNNLDDWKALQQFKADHWDHEKNMLQLEYWPEFDRMYHAYQRKRMNMMRQPQQELKTMKAEYPLTKQEAMNIITSTDNADQTAFINEWVEVPTVTPRTIGKTVKVTELSLFD